MYAILKILGTGTIYTFRASYTLLVKEISDYYRIVVQYWHTHEFLFVILFSKIKLKEHQY